MMATMVLLPDWRLQLSSTLSDVERNRSSCHPSGSSPSARANATRSRASLRSSARLTIARTLKRPQDGCVRRWVRLQGPDYDRPKFQPFGGDVEVHHQALVKLTGELAQQLQVTPSLG